MTSSSLDLGDFSFGRSGSLLLPKVRNLTHTPESIPATISVSSLKSPLAYPVLVTATNLVIIPLGAD